MKHLPEEFVKIEVEASLGESSQEVCSKSFVITAKAFLSPHFLDDVPNMIVFWVASWQNVLVLLYSSPYC